jgi:hypothetical protein
MSKTTSVELPLPPKNMSEIYMLGSPQKNQTLCTELTYAEVLQRLFLEVGALDILTAERRDSNHRAGALATRDI